MIRFVCDSSLTSFKYLNALRGLSCYALPLGPLPLNQSPWDKALEFITGGKYDEPLKVNIVCCHPAHVTTPVYRSKQEDPLFGRSVLAPVKSPLIPTSEPKELIQGPELIFDIAYVEQITNIAILTQAEGVESVIPVLKRYTQIIEAHGEGMRFAASVVWSPGDLRTYLNWLAV